jgi:hypothetical protein
MVDDRDDPNDPPDWATEREPLTPFVRTASPGRLCALGAPRGDLFEGRLKPSARRWSGSPSRRTNSAPGVSARPAYPSGPGVLCKAAARAIPTSSANRHMIATSRRRGWVPLQRRNGRGAQDMLAFLEATRSSPDRIASMPLEAAGGCGSPLALAPAKRVARGVRGRQHRRASATARPSAYLLARSWPLGGGR